jgi:quercetin dioxygenase-like cupin family protein
MLTDRELIEMLLAVAPQAPPRETADRIKARVRRRVQPAAGFITLRREEGWQPFVGGTQMKVLHDDGCSLSWLVRMPAGTELPAHRHDDGVEECLVLDGEVIVNEVRYSPGDYVLAPRGSEHYSVRTDTGALFFLRSPSPKAQAARAHAG